MTCRKTFATRDYRGDRHATEGSPEPVLLFVLIQLPDLGTWHEQQAAQLLPVH